MLAPLNRFIFPGFNLLRQTRAVRFFSSSPKFYFPQPSHTSIECRFTQLSVTESHALERIKWPAKNMPDRIHEIARDLNELTRAAFWGHELGVDFILAQLKNTKYLDIYRNKTTGEIDQYARLEVYEDVPGKPISAGVFKKPRPFSGVRNIFARVILTELADRIGGADPNPTVKHINCAFSPRGYEICKEIADKIVPDLDHVQLVINGGNDKNNRTFCDETVRRWVHGQLELAKASDLEVAKMFDFYIGKMLSLNHDPKGYDPDRFTLIGQIPIPREIIPLVNARDPDITLFFNQYLNMARGDMLVFYSEVNYQSLINKLKKTEFA